MYYWIIMLLVIFFIFCQYSGTEYYGTAWFPRVFLKMHRNTTRMHDNIESFNTNVPRHQLESPNFASFDNGNDFKGENEVGSLFQDIKNTVWTDKFYSAADIMYNDSNTINYDEQHMNLSNRGGNA